MLPGKDGEAVDKDLALYLREHEGLVKDIDGIRKDFLAIVESAERMFRYEYYDNLFFFLNKTIPQVYRRLSTISRPNSWVPICVNMHLEMNDRM